MGVVLLISSIVLFYSHQYMAGDVRINRFIVLVFLFVLSIIFFNFIPQYSENFIRLRWPRASVLLFSYLLPECEVS